MDLDPIDVLAAMCDDVAVLIDEGRFEDALQLSQLALAFGQNHLESSDPMIPMLMQNVAQAYEGMGLFLEAERWAVDALQQLKLVVGPSDPHVALLLQNLGGIYQQQAKYLEASRQFDDAADLLRHLKMTDEPLYAQVLHNQASLYGLIGDYERAIPLSTKAVELRRRAEGADSTLYATSLANLGGLYFEIGAITEAFTYFERAKALITTNNRDDHPLVGLCLQHEGGYYHDIGAFDIALPLLDKSLAIWRDALPGGHPDIAKGLHNLGGLHLDLGNYAEAERLLLEALEIRRDRLGEDHPLTANTLNSLAGVYQETGRYGDAASLFEESAETIRTSLGEDSPEYAQSLHNLARLAENRGDDEAAKIQFKASSAIYQGKFGDRHPDLAKVLNGLALLLRRRGDFAGAESNLRRALTISHTCFGDEHPSVAMCASNLASLLAATGRRPSALALEQWSRSIENGLIRRVFSVTSEKKRRVFLESLSGGVDSYASLVIEGDRSSEHVRALFELVLRRKGIEAEALAIQQTSALRRHHPDLAAKIDRFESLKTQIAKRELEGPGELPFASHKELLAEWKERFERLEDELVRRIPELGGRYRFASADTAGVAACLPASSALIEFLAYRQSETSSTGETKWSGPRYLAFVLTPGDGEKISVIELGDASVIDEMIGQFRQAIELTGSTRNVAVVRATAACDAELASLCTRLRAALLDQVIPCVGTADRLFFAPDGELNNLPFEALALNDGRYLLERYEVAYVASGRDILRWTETKRGGSAPVIVGDPDFNLAVAGDPPNRPTRPMRGPVGSLAGTLAEFVRLPQTEMEARAVASVLAGGEIWLKDAALDPRLKQIRSPRVLHVATHGVFAASLKPTQQSQGYGFRSLQPFGADVAVAGVDNPLLRSCLVLAGANTWLRGNGASPTAEDGLLTAEDVTGMDLIDTELVVLSACDTGRGEIRCGEGVYGLQRAFSISGAKTLVMSLWRIPDEETRELMVSFYQGLIAGLGRSEALRRAKLALRTKHAHPYYWAGFICQGNPAPFAI